MVSLQRHMVSHSAHCSAAMLVLVAKFESQLMLCLADTLGGPLTVDSCFPREVRPSSSTLAPHGSSRGRRPDSVRFTVAELRSAPGIYSIVVLGKANATEYELVVEMRRAAAGLAAGDRCAMEQARVGRLAAMRRRRCGAQAGW